MPAASPGGAEWTITGKEETQVEIQRVYLGFKSNVFSSWNILLWNHKKRPQNKFKFSSNLYLSREVIYFLVSCKCTEYILCVWEAAWDRKLMRFKWKGFCVRVICFHCSIVLYLNCLLPCVISVSFKFNHFLSEKSFARIIFGPRPGREV